MFERCEVRDEASMVETTEKAEVNVAPNEELQAMAAEKRVVRDEVAAPVAEEWLSPGTITDEGQLGAVEPAVEQAEPPPATERPIGRSVVSFNKKSSDPVPAGDIDTPYQFL